MFYNSKKLLDEKVLQQYYFEEFMLSNSTQRKKLLPPQYHEYGDTRKVKVLRPEVTLGETVSGKKHKTDFVLYPIPGVSLDKMNIEIKWIETDFANQSERFPYYDGRKGEGFLVCLKYGDNENSHVMNPKTRKSTNIPIVYLNAEKFSRWFARSANEVIAQALKNKLGIPFRRITGPKYWVVAITDKSLSHYLEHGRKAGIWAFRDQNRPVNTMNILDDDYIVFVHFDHCIPGRCVYPAYPKKRMIETYRKTLIDSSTISWSIRFMDIVRVSKGYHIDFTDKAPYGGFDEKWLNKKHHRPEEKEYTQFIRTIYDKEDDYCYLWNKSNNFTLDRDLFPVVNKELAEFVNALRTSLNSRGDALEISRNAFYSINQMLARF